MSNFGIAKNFRTNAINKKQARMNTSFAFDDMLNEKEKPKDVTQYSFFSKPNFKPISSSSSTSSTSSSSSSSSESQVDEKENDTIDIKNAHFNKSKLNNKKDVGTIKHVDHY